MTAVTSAQETELVDERRFGRRQITGLTFGVLGLGMILGISPNITSDERAFAFERPPDPLEFSFSPPTIVVIIGVVYLLAAGLAFLPSSYDKWSGAYRYWQQRRPFRSSS